jgi:hypothetical protein
VVYEVARAELIGDGAVAGGEALVEDPLHHRVRGRASLAGGRHLILPKFNPKVFRMNSLSTSTAGSESPCFAVGTMIGTPVGLTEEPSFGPGPP